MGRVNIEIPDNAHRKMKSVCALKGLTIIDYINEALKEKLNREKV